jgi:hypothetical protein
MIWLLGVVVGTVIGLLLGFGSKRLPVRPLLQTLVAAWLAPILAAAAMILILVWKSELYLLLVAGLHGAAGRSRRLTPHRPILFGLLGGLFGAVPFAWAISVLSS